MNKKVITLERWSDITEEENKKYLIGNRIEKIRFNEEYLVLEFPAHVFAVSVEGGCCSTSYFYDFYGIDKILDHTIEDIQRVELDPTDLKASHDVECVQVYGYKIICKDNVGDYNYFDTSRTAVFSFRNDSNGYYGGSMCNVSSNFNYEEVPEISKDVTGV